MPTRPLSHSARLGRARHDRAYDQTRRSTDPALAYAKRVRSSQAWRDLRAVVLSKQPLCADPYGTHAQQGRVEVATQVDHVVPIHEAPARAMDEGNLRGLCSACHGRKTGSERR